MQRHVDVVDRARGQPRVELPAVQTANVVRGEGLQCGGRQVAVVGAPCRAITLAPGQGYRVYLPTGQACTAGLTTTTVEA